MLNVEDELPGIPETYTPEYDPEAESVPVSVTMPESTKTAEDKLMADIAEAMTGNPLSLDSQEAPAYNIPGNFFTDSASNGDSPQSAEDKLKANIAQALSESPINAAQEQAHQNLEDDINPFDEPETPDVFPQDDGDDSQNPPDEHDDAADSEAPQTDGADDNELMPELDAMPETETETADDTYNDPFTIPDFGDDEPDTYTESEPAQEADIFSADDGEPEQQDMPESDAATIFDTEEDTEPEHAQESDMPADIGTAQEQETLPESELIDDDDMPSASDVAGLENESEPLTEQESLEREISAVTQEYEPADSIMDNEPDFDINTLQEEAEPENNMPGQSLTDEGMPEGISTEETNDDWDLSSLGELGEAAVITEDDSDENFSAAPGTVTEMITQPEAGIIHNPEDDHKEKTMNIREKLASRKNTGQDAAKSGKKSSGGGFLLPAVMIVLAVIGALILWQLMQLSDKITSIAMSSSGFESVQGAETVPSYEYAIDFILDPNITDRMAQRGRAGWQVVGSRRTQDSTTGQYGYEFIFMRRTPGR